jgi:DNA-binding NtrC family response regulator
MLADESDLALAAVTTVPVLIVASDERRRHAMARGIHDRSGRCACAWVAISGGLATPTDLATAFGRAQGGTVFVDFLEALSEPAQHRLAELLDTPATVGWGGEASHPRIIAGAGPGLWDVVVERRFSEPLFYRVNIIRLDVTTFRISPSASTNRGGGLARVFSAGDTEAQR